MHSHRVATKGFQGVAMMVIAGFQGFLDLSLVRIIHAVVPGLFICPVLGHISSARNCTLPPSVLLCKYLRSQVGKVNGNRKGH